MPALVNSASAAPSPRRSTCQLAGAKQLWFADLHDQTILSPRGIGFWEQIYQHRIPGSSILYQRHAHDYSELVNYSILPYFTINLTQLDDKRGAGPAAESADHSAHRPGRPAEVLRLLFQGKPAVPDVSDPAASGPVGQGRLRLKDSPGINLAPGLLYRTTSKHSVRFRMFGGCLVYLVSCNKVSPASS